MTSPAYLLCSWLGKLQAHWLAFWSASPNVGNTNNAWNVNFNNGNVNNNNRNNALPVRLVRASLWSALCSL